MRPRHRFSHRGFRPAAALVLSGMLALAASAQVVPWRTKIAASPDAHTLPQDRGADGLVQTLRKLDTWASLLFVVAHPDDEDGGMLAYESRGHGVRTALVTLTRGEGGQDAMSGASNDALGLIRTNELLRADQYYATEQYFATVVDYGFSKTLAEAHQKWGRQRVLCDVIRIVREDRPLVLASTFTGNITDGHGHHQASGEANQDAYLDAGNPAVCPDQIAQGLRPWAPLKVYARQPFFSPSSKGIFDYATNKWYPVRFYDYVTKQWNDRYPTTTFRIPEGTWDPVLGQSYVQLSRTGWGMQKSQNGGGGGVPLPGPSFVSYHLYGSRVPVTKPTEDSFFDGIDTSLPGMASLVHSGDTAFLVAGLRRIQDHVRTAQSSYQPDHPEKIAPELALGYQATQQLLDKIQASSLSAADKANLDHELRIKLAQFNTALAESLGLQVNALLSTGEESRFVPRETPTTVTPGSQIQVHLRVTAADPDPDASPVQLTRVWLANPDGDHWSFTRIFGTDSANPAPISTDVDFRVDIPSHAQLTRPYFTRPNVEQAVYDITDPRWVGRPFAPYPLAGWAEFLYRGVPIRIGQIVQTLHRVHGIGGVYQPLAVVPRISVNLPGSAGVIRLGQSAVDFAVSVGNQQPSLADGTLDLELPSGWSATPASADFHLAPGANQDFSFTLHPGPLASQPYQVRAVATSAGQQFTEGFTTVGYPGLRPYYLYAPACYTFRGVDVKLPPHLNVGYIMGTGDTVPEDLTQIGIHAHILLPAELAQANLSAYDAIIVGIRAYTSGDGIAAVTPRLFDYVRNGGTLIVQYQSDDFPAPYPLSLGDNPEKVVVETDPVVLLQSDNPLLTWPNRITPADFNGWIEERGHSFLASWSREYTALTETHDPGQDPQKGGLIYARCGKGIWIYDAYALYRQLPQAVPGAYRLFANLVSAGRNPNFH
ncbi:MAG TPA: PIG-L family deacetylase [Acidobacteriaceae bacterium]|nr:PIG-L family deacetylase [Acidobacteriaceae bacterium]